MSETEPQSGDLDVVLEHNPRMRKPWRVTCWIYRAEGETFRGEAGWYKTIGSSLIGEPYHIRDFRSLRKAVHYRAGLLADVQVGRIYAQEFSDRWERVL